MASRSKKHETWHTWLAASAASVLILGSMHLDASLAWLAGLRVAAAGLGAFFLARKLGLAQAGASLAAVGFGSSGFLVCRMESADGRVVPFLPWILLAIEGARDARSAPRSLLLITVLSALSTWVGDAESTAFGLIASAIWIASGWSSDRRCAVFGMFALIAGAGLSVVAWPSFAEWLRDPSALVSAHDSSDAGRFDFIALSLVVIATAVVLRWRALAASARGQGPEWAGVVGVALCVLAGVAIAAQRGLPEKARMVLVGDVFGAPNGSGYRGHGAFVEGGSLHLALVVLGLGIASLFSARGEIERRRSIQVLALVSLLLAIEFPGVVDAWRMLPMLGRVDPARAAGVSALFMALLAGDALEACASAARRAAALVVMGLLVLCFVHRAGPVITAEMGVPDPPDGLVEWSERPGTALDGSRVGLAGAIHPAVAFDRMSARIEALDMHGRVIAGESREVAITDDRARFAPAGNVPARNIPFRASDLDIHRLHDGVWRFSIDFYRRDAQGRDVRTATRTVSVSALSREPRLSIVSASLALATLAVLLSAPAVIGWAGWMAVLLALVQALRFACTRS